MANPETNLTRRIMKKLDELPDGFFFKVHGVGYHQAGVSDIIGCWGGRFIALEVKIPKRRNNVEPSQVHFIAKVRAAGGIAGVICSWDDFVELTLEQAPDLVIDCRKGGKL